MHAHTHAHTRARAPTHTHTHTHMHALTHTHTHTSSHFCIMKYFLRFEVKKITLLFVQVPKLRPLYIIIIPKNEGCNNTHHNGHNTLRRHLSPNRAVGLCRRCGAEEETSAHILCECEALASHRYAYLGSFLLEPEDIKEYNSWGHLEL